MDLKLCLLVVFVGSIRAQSSSAPLNKLVDDLLSHYNKIVPPALAGVNVSHSLTLLRIVSMEDQILTLDTFDAMSWTDGRLTWDPASYDGIDSIRIPASKLWLPDITLYNDANDPKAWMDINTVVTNSGHVTYVPKVKFASYCDYKEKTLKRFRKITCELKFGSWTYDASQVDMFNPTGDFVLGDLVPNPNWKLVDSSAVREEKKYDCCPEMYTTVKYSLTLKVVTQ